jgi:hypothetical protein
MFEMKCHRPLRKLPYKSKILVLHDEGLSTSVLLEVLSNYKNKGIHLFTGFRTDTNEIDNSGLDKRGFCILDSDDIRSKQDSFDFKDFSKFVNIEDLINLNEVIQNLNIDFVIFGSTVEEQSINVFLDLCKGNQIKGSDCDSTHIINNKSVQFLNLFQEVKQKEVLYYSILKNLDCSFTSNTTQQKLTFIIDKFIKKIDRDNSLALFNVLKTAKKLD